jgi:sugar lactone lactonase YvrE
LVLLAGSVLGCRAERRVPPGPPAQRIAVADTGFRTPESVLYDEAADAYIVSNINGSPLDKDDNGFLSRLAPDGSVMALKWVDGAAPEVTLNAPKGMAIKGDTLFVADIDALRLFHRVSGAALGSRMVPGATFLNDVAVGPDGTVYVTDSGLKAGAQGFAPSGTDAVYRFDASGKPVAVARDTALGRPNGILADSTGLTVVTFGSGEVFRLDPSSGAKQALPKPPQGGLDGVVRSADGSLLVSSWDGRAIYRLAAGGWTVAVDSLEAPADIGYDGKRARVLIPLFTANRVVLQPIR